MDEFETLSLNMFQPSGDLFTSFGENFWPISSSDLSDPGDIPVDSERMGGEWNNYCVIT